MLKGFLYKISLVLFVLYCIVFPVFQGKIQIIQSYKTTFGGKEKMKIFLSMVMLGALSTFDFTIILACVLLVAFVVTSMEMKSKLKSVDYL